MQTLIEFPLVRVEALEANQLPDFCTLVLPYASPQLCHFNGDVVLLQTYRNYMLCIELFEYQWSKATRIGFNVIEPGFFLFVMSNGDSVLLDRQKQEISDMKGNSNTLTYLNAGNYYRRFAKGKHKILSVTFKQDWFLEQMADFASCSTLVSSYENTEMHCVLPHCNGGVYIFNAVAKLFLTAESIVDREKEILDFVRDVLNTNQEKLLHREYDANTFEKQKIAEIVSYVELNYASDLVADVRHMTRHFNVSKRAFFRLCQKAFGKPLNKVVTICKMQHCYNQLLCTDKSIHQIALEMGYSDQSYFCRIFKEQFKKSPTEVRKP